MLRPRGGRSPLRAFSIELTSEITPCHSGSFLSLLVIFLFGGFSGRFGGYGYGYGHGGVGIIGTILIIVVVLMLLGRL